MIKNEQYMKLLQSIQGKTIAIVYIFEGEDAPGFRHYHVWKSDVITLWMNAVQSLNCIPLLLDVRTFVEKALNKTMPTIDFVINLNCGSCELSSMSLIPATCAFIGVPCIPCNAVTIVTGENKRLSNLIAGGIGLNVAKELISSDKRGIYRPLNLGSSCGVGRGKIPEETTDGLYQEFLPGYDITTPIVYNPLKEDFEIFPSIIYLPDSEDLNWYFGEEEKTSGKGYRRCVISSLSEELKKTYLKLVRTMDINTYCRIDARLRCEDISLAHTIRQQPLSLENMYFVEINPMPTIKLDNSFGFCFSSITKKDAFYPCVEMFQKTIGDTSVHSFLLSCAMLALKSRTIEKII